jgi:glycine/D-amino acid oxidase-like deaminating enzyme
MQQTTLSSDHLRGAQIVVIGAGVVGAAASYRLAQAGAQVTTVERRFPGGGTSSASFAWLNGFNKAPRQYSRLNVQAIRDQQDLCDELEGDWAHLDGGLHWERVDQPAKLENLHQGLRRFREWGVRLDRTTPEIAMRELEPDLWIDPEVVPEVYVVPREGWIDTIGMAHGTLRAARLRYGARFEQGNVVGLRGPKGAIDQVVLEDGRTLPADLVINAAGPDGARVAELAGQSLALDRQIGLIMITGPAPVSIRHVVYSGDARLRPASGSRYVLHPEYVDAFADESQPLPLDGPLTRRALEETSRTVPGLAHPAVESIRVGVRPMPRDGYPIVGFDPAVSGLYHLLTHSGVTLAARLALLVTEELCGGDTSDLEPYRPGRFAE